MRQSSHPETTKFCPYMYPVDERRDKTNTATKWSQDFLAGTLQQIFLLVGSESGDAPCSSAMILSHVCSRWRQIVLGYSPLWTFLTAQCAPGLETLRLCVGDAEDCETPTAHSVGGDYIARVNEQHLPNLPFFGDVFTLYHGMAPNLRHMSLTNCYIRPASIKGSPNLERLEMSHGSCSLGHNFVSDWVAIIRCLPCLTFLSIDGAMTWDPSYCSTKRDLLTEPPPVTQLQDLRINRCSPACASLLHIFAPQPRSLQLTFTDVRYNEEFNLFCDALQAWFRDWQADTPNPYLYVSIQPEGIIVHNRSTRQESVSTCVESSPSLQLTLYWQAEYAGEKWLGLISAVLNFISTLEPYPDPTFYSLTSPLTRGCEELELSVGLFDYEDEALRTVITEFLSRFGDVKKLTCIGGAAAMLPSEARQVRDVSLLPFLEYLCFDHVDFKAGLEKKLEDFLRHDAKLCQTVGQVALNGCHNVSQSFFKSLGRICAKVILGHGTVLVDDDCRRSVRGIREPWTKDQAKVSSSLDKVFPF